MSRPLIALLSDFGTADHYVGTMKGVMLGICPEAALVDITHDVPPHDVRTGARQLAASYTYFPAGTVFLAVVDPGVGSSRRGIAVETADHRFVAPDNGLLSAVLDEAPARRVVELTERKFARATISRTFEGRDRFAPGRGLAGQGRGHHHHGAQRGRPGPPGVAGGRSNTPTGSKARSRSSIASATSSPTWAAMPSSGWCAPAAIDIAIAGHPVPRLVATYADVAAGELCALFGSSDHLEIAISGGSAAAALGVGVGAPVRLSRPGL